MNAGALIREARERHGLSQRALARRARTSPAWVSRLERGEVTPSVAALDRLLRAMGERLDLRTKPIDPLVDRETLAELRALPPEMRLERALAWNRFAAEVSDAGRRARR